MIIENFPFITCMILIIFGIYTLLFKKNLIKLVIGITIIESGVNLFLVTLGYRENSVAPIFTFASSEKMVLPTPQALTLTSIVIGFATTALMLSFVIFIYHHYKTIEIDEMRRLEKR